MSRICLPLIAVVLMALGCMPRSAKADEGAGLEGKIWRVADNTFISVTHLLDDLEKARFVLIGERHGRRAHQNREAFLLAALAERKRYPGVVFEMLTHSQDPIVADYRRRSPEYAVGLGAALGWHKTHWPAWSFYAPVFQVAFGAKLPIVGADLTEQDRERISNSSLDPLPEADPRRGSWSASLKNAHCDQIGETRLSDLTRLQLVRDETMARALEEVAGRADGAVLIAGSAHVRKDRGVPTYLESQDVRSVALLETRKGKSPAEHLPASVGGKRPVYDYVWFTPRLKDLSVCERLRKRGLLK